MTSGPKSGPFGRRGTWVAGGIATALLIAWALAGDGGAVRRLDSDPEALELLRETAAAAHRTPFEGTRTQTTFTTGGQRRTVVKVAHPTNARAAVGAAAVEDAPRAGDIGELAGFTPATINLLARNYAVVKAADGLACGRKARVVEARRPDGTLAGRFWIDAQTGILLHRELLDDGGRVVSTVGYSDLRIAQPRATSAAAQMTAWPSAQVAALRRQGWTVPGGLPGGFVLQDVRRSGSGNQGTLHLAYSDGLAMLSIFVQRGRLDPRRLSGWHRSTAAGRQLYRRDDQRRWAVWAADGYVYTVLADAPHTASARLVTALPHTDAGWWARMRRGARRIGTWANPWN